MHVLTGDAKRARWTRTQISVLSNLWKRTPKQMWKYIPGFEGQYMANENGMIKSVKRTITSKTGQKYTLPEKILKQNKNKNGYMLVQLSKNGKIKGIYVHRIVAILFIPNPNNLPTVNHKDGNKQNCNAENLEWTSYSQNNQHAYDTGLKPKGEGQYKAKLTEKDVREIRKNGKNGTFEEIALRYGVSKATIRDVLLYRTWKNP